jgi:TfoX/Sxy family transcriptional regulator of competence genes
MTMGYYSVPPSVLEDPAALAEWASRAVKVAAAAARAPRRTRSGR